MSKLLSIIIATRNRAPFLARCLESLARVTFDRDAFEVLVVDNASEDRTRQVFEAEAGRTRVPLRYVLEPRKGLSRARNRGVEAAVGGYVVFLDDDLTVTPGTLRAYQEHFCTRGDAIVQARIIPQFMSSAPRWLTREQLPKYGQVDQGDRPGPLRGHLHGVSFGVARHVFQRIGTFREDLGAGAIGLGEDTEFGLRAEAAGFHAAYAPGALVYHWIPPSRVTRTAFLRRAYLSGLCQPLLRTYDDATLRMLLSLGKDGLKRLLGAVWATDSARHMAELCELAEHAGRVVQILRQRIHG